MSEPGAQVSASEATGNFELVPLDELFDNHDEFAAASAAALDGSSFAVAFADCGELTATFGSGRVAWSCERPTPWGTEGDDAFVAELVRPGIFAITIDRLEERCSSLAVLDLEAQRVAVVVTELVGPDDEVRERTSVYQGALGGGDLVPAERTDELVGLRVHHRYSTTHAFEHIYVDADHYVWHGIEGPEAGMGGFEPAEAYRIADQLYLFTWHERASPFNGTILIDLKNKRSTGRLFGWHLDQHRSISVQTGSVSTILNRTDYTGL